MKHANMIPKAVVGVNRAIAAAIGATRDESDDSDPNGYAGSIQSPHVPQKYMASYSVCLGLVYPSGHGMHTSSASGQFSVGTNLTGSRHTSAL